MKGKLYYRAYYVVEGAGAKERGQLELSLENYFDNGVVKKMDDANLLFIVFKNASS